MATPTAVDGIRLCRTQAGLSARALSIQAGLGDSYVSKVEAGSIAPSLRAFSRIVVVLGLSDAEIAVLVRLAAATHAAEALA